MSNTTRNLSMKFDSNLGRPVTISIPHCRQDITAAEAESVMDGMVAAPIFTFDLTGVKSASVIERTVNDLF
jgi:hypothetical protein